MLNLRRTATKQLLLSQRALSATKTLQGSSSHTVNRRAIDTTSFWEQQQQLARSLWLLTNNAGSNNDAAIAAVNFNSNLMETNEQGQRALYATDESGFDDDFKAQRKTPDQERTEQVMQRIDQDIKNNAIVLYMKGTPSMPQCGFSRAVTQVLSLYGYKYISFDMNADILMKETLKQYSDWPTIPQLYVKGEFVGGCDIVLNMHREGKLGEVLSTSGAEKAD